LLLPILAGSCVSSTTNTGPTKDRLAAILTKARKKFTIPALGAVVLGAGGIREDVVLGVRDINGSDPASSRDYFHLGSNTKAVTGFLAAKLVRDGLIGWETRFLDLFPELAAESRGDYREITLRDLLSHRAWVPPMLSSKDYKTIPELGGDIENKRIQFSSYMLKRPPQRTSPQSPFKAYAYSKAGYVMAAAMLEKVSGRSWEALIDEVLVRDLGLPAHVGFPVDLGPDQPRGHLPGSYVGEDPSQLVIYDTEYVLRNRDVLNPAGNLSMPMIDYAKFIQLHLQGLEGMDNYLPADMYRFMHFGIAQYAIGWGNARKNGADVSSHSGSAGNFFCHARFIPEKDLAIVVFANSGIVNHHRQRRWLCGPGL
jgi:CubicO group peptidase (beta-lactamase class C family)